ncbi:MAG TPA: aminoacyl-tRNA hydrolase [Chloroflexota bacterium]
MIVGLGNPGPEFADTRHNVGYRCVDSLARRYAAAWQDRTASLSSLAAVVRPSADRPLILAKPHTFMNRSGRAVRDLAAFLHLDSDQILVVYDDMDLPPGTLRLRERGSPGTHNGMRSVVAEMGSEAIPRLRIGIGQASPGDASGHVLSEFAPSERDRVDELIERAADAALAWAMNGAAVAMNRYNKT